MRVHSTRIVIAGVVAVSLVAGIAWAAGDWRAAKEKVHELESKQAEVKKLAVQESMPGALRRSASSRTGARRANSRVCVQGGRM